MSIFHFSAKAISRSKDANSVNKAAYNSRSNLTDLNTGRSYYYRSKGNVFYSEILTPDDAPRWLEALKHDREGFWSEVERCERRKDAQVAREVEISLPHELTKDQCKKLTVNYVREFFVSKGMVADVAIHDSPPDGDERNIHAHILLTMREITSEGFGLKERSWNERSLIEKWREGWAIKVNTYLGRYGHKERVDHRSLEAQGISRIASRYKGKARTDIERRRARKREQDGTGKEIETDRIRQAEKTYPYRSSRGIEIDI